MATEDVSRTRAWLIATRPHTLPAAAAPVAVGTGMAVALGYFAPIPAFAALLGALLIQVGTNLANDYYDAETGVDTDDSEGFTRVTQSGLIAPNRVKLAMWATFATAIVVGVYLVAVAGLPILVIGLLSVASGIIYAGGPYPLGSHGLGDLFVFVFFGVIAVTGTVYVQAAHVLSNELFPTAIFPAAIPPAAVVASLPAAAISTNILVVNNIRDMETDRAAGKRTLAVLVGYRWSRVEYGFMLALAYLAPLWLWIAGDFALHVLLPLVTAPYAAVVARTVMTEDGGEPLNWALERTGKLLTAHSVLFSVGLAV